MKNQKVSFLRSDGFILRIAQVIIISGLFLNTLSCKDNNPVSNIDENTMTDIDGNVYKTVKIGTQVWMAENLRTTKYNDGASMLNITDSVEWYNIDNNNLTTPAYCYYNNTTNVDSIKKFGALYNWFALDTKKLAPSGWHVPTDWEWRIMEDYLVLHGYNYDGTTDTSDYNKIAKSLAAKTDWCTDTGIGTIGCNLTINNSTGFSALPGGYRLFDGSFRCVGALGVWWSPTYVKSSVECNRNLGWVSQLFKTFLSKRDGYSVRLIRD